MGANDSLVIIIALAGSLALIAAVSLTVPKRDQRIGPSAPDPSAPHTRYAIRRAAVAGYKVLDFIDRLPAWLRIPPPW